MTSLKKRDQFLIQMYNQLMNEINRHILITWQSLTALMATFAVFTLVNESYISYNTAISAILVAIIWFMAHVYDASYWYNRNLVIIANIERQFLIEKDLKEIHYYFGKHRPHNKMISHFRYQIYLAFAIIFFALLFHLCLILLPLTEKENEFTHSMIMPWLIFVLGIRVVLLCHRDGKNKYREFIENSPGKMIKTDEIKYGNGHGFKGNP